MIIARIENGAVAETRDMDISAIPEHKRAAWRVVAGGVPDFDRNTHTCTGPVYTVQGDGVAQVWTVAPRDIAEVRAVAAADINKWFGFRWSSFFLDDPARTQERETMAEIAIRCSSPDAAVAAANRAIMEAEGAIYGQTADQRIEARISERARAHLSGSKLSLLRQAAMTAISTASLEAIPGIVATTKAEMDAVA